MTKLLIIGGDSAVGAFLHKSLCKKYDVLTTSRRSASNADFLLDVEDISTIIDLKLPSDLVVIWCVNTNNDTNLALNQNESSVVELRGIECFLSRYHNLVRHFVYFSSDAIFGNKICKPGISSPRLGTSNYAKHKIRIEELLEKKFKNTTCIRMGKVIETSEFLLNSVRSIRNNHRVSAFTNFLFSPIDLRVVSETIKLLVENDRPPFVHLANLEEISYFEACVRITKILGKSDTLVIGQYMPLDHINYRETSLLSDVIKGIEIKKPLDYLDNITS